MLSVNVLVTELPDGVLTAKVGREIGPLLAEGRMLRNSGKVPRGVLLRSHHQAPVLEWSGAVAAIASIPENKTRKIRGRE